MSLSDAQLVALPVRSLKGGFAYATSPLALARMQRLAGICAIEAKWEIPSVAANHAITSSDGLLTDGKLILEAFEFTASANDGAGKIATALAAQVFASDPASFFAGKLKTDLVILSDTDFAHFARHAMVVEAHVRINDESGTADDGGLFYVENLPPESILVGLAQASIERYKKEDRNTVPDRMDDAARILDIVFKGKDTLPGIGGKTLQIGGDASTGRGLVLVQPVAVTA